eukprot:TRINITY_DN9355_c0_g1_i16.p1 TRINITY_DN9355_c0_g1~~TRINITY_DN9355_c0_g1_i16.p1  ORF type:complete len:170 (-),score=60.83 TRINITY_DN9355_c0_g1_i16:180-689(-)
MPNRNQFFPLYRNAMGSGYSEMQFMPNFGRHGYPYLQTGPSNDGNNSDSEDEENEALFQKAPEAQPAVLEELKEAKEQAELAGKREEAEKSEEEKARIARSEEVVLDENDSDESDSEPQDCDLVLGQYDEVQRTKNKIGRRYKCKLSKVILKIGQRDYVTSKLTAEIEY